MTRPPPSRPCNSALPLCPARGVSAPCQPAEPVTLRRPPPLPSYLPPTAPPDQVEGHRHGPQPHPLLPQPRARGRQRGAALHGAHPAGGVGHQPGPGAGGAQPCQPRAQADSRGNSTATGSLTEPSPLPCRHLPLLPCIRVSRLPLPFPSSWCTRASWTPTTASSGRCSRCWTRSWARRGQSAARREVRGGRGEQGPAGRGASTCLRDSLQGHIAGGPI